MHVVQGSSAKSNHDDEGMTDSDKVARTMQYMFTT